MLEKSEMWDRFFRGSKYEAKWHGLDRDAKVVVLQGRMAEISGWLERVAIDRRPTAMKQNPFDRLAVKRSAT